MTNITRAFAAYLLEKAGRIGPEVLERAKRCKRDYDAVTEAGARRNQARWAPLLAKLPAGNAELIGYAQRTDPKTAALINGFNAHTLELDDGQRFAMIHLGASVISALSAAASEYTISKEDFLRGVVMGYEAACRLSIAIQPSHKMRGYHAAGTCGTVGAATGVSFALRMDAQQLRRVLTAAAGSAAGLLEIQEQGSQLKPYNLGRAAMDGLAAADMGFVEFETPEDLLGGERGFFKLFADASEERKLICPEEYFEIERIYVKPYASCRHSHSAVEAAIRLHARIDPAQIDHVLVETYALGVKGHDHTAICGVSSAKLSTPYAVAAALLYGRADLSVFEPLNKAAADFAPRIKVVENKALSGLCPGKRAAIVTVYLNDGTERRERTDYAKGEPENPLTEEEIEEKCRMLAACSGRG